MSPADERALVVLSSVGQWAKCHLADGRKAYGIPSSTDPSVRYLANAFNCTCPDHRRYPSGTCKHMLAVRLHVLNVRGAR